MSHHTNHNSSTVVGVFPDQQWADQAMQALRSAGFKAKVADKSVVGNLANMGIDRNAAGIYSDRLGEGDTVLIVEDAQNRGEDALGIMLQNGAENIDLSHDNVGSASNTASTTTTTTSKTSTGTGYDADYYKKLDRQQRQYGQYDQSLGRARSAEEMNVLLREETLSAVKQNVQAGEVQVNKVVHEKQQEIPVTLRHEEVVIERHPVDRAANADEIGDMSDQTISVPVYEERAELQKQARVREEVTIGKRTEEQQQVLTGTTRHEHLEVNQSGDVDVVGDSGTGAVYDNTNDADNVNKQNRR